MTLGNGALPRLFQKLLLGAAIAAGPASAEAAADDDKDDRHQLSEADRAIVVVLDSMVDRAIEHRRDVTEILVVLLGNMHPLEATASVCETALSPHAEVRRLLCDALARVMPVGGPSVLEYLSRDADPAVRHAAVRAARRYPA